MILPLASVAIRMFNAKRRLPYNILALVSPSARYVEGHNLLWPMEYCLPMSNIKFAYKYNLLGTALATGAVKLPGRWG